MARVPKCEFTEVTGFDNRSFKLGERICVKRDGETLLGTFRGTLADGYLVSGVDPEPSREDTVGYSDVGRLMNKLAVPPTVVTQLARQKGLPEDVEREIKKYGGKKSRKSRGKNKKKRLTRKR